MRADLPEVVVGIAGAAAVDRTPVAEPGPRAVLLYSVLV